MGLELSLERPSKTFLGKHQTKDVHNELVKKSLDMIHSLVISILVTLADFETFEVQDLGQGDGL